MRLIQPTLKFVRVNKDIVLEVTEDCTCCAYKKQHNNWFMGYSGNMFHIKKINDENLKNSFTIIVGNTPLIKHLERALSVGYTEIPAINKYFRAE